jgi:hypothetical protein
MRGVPGQFAAEDLRLLQQQQRKSSVVADPASALAIAHQ